MVTGSMDRTAKLWDVSSGRELLTLKWHLDDVHSVAFSSDGTRIVTSSDDQTVKIWDAATPEEIAVWQQQDEHAAAVARTWRMDSFISQ